MVLFFSLINVYLLFYYMVVLFLVYVVFEIGKVINFFFVVGELVIFWYIFFFSMVKGMSLEVMLDIYWELVIKLYE